jgi:hypothetical protein
MQRGERIISDLRPGIGDGGDERRFAGIRHTQQTDIGEHFQLQPQIASFAFLAFGLLPRRAIRRRLEMDIAPAAFAAFGDQDFLAMLGQIGNELAIVLSMISVPTGMRRWMSSAPLP